MSRALAVFHGRFGRATVYQLNRPFNIHAHREGHLIFHVGGRSACIDVSDGRYELTEGSVVAVNPWEPHNFLPSDLEGGAVFFVLYVNAEWFSPDAPGADRLRFGRTQFTRSRVSWNFIPKGLASCGTRPATIARSRPTRMFRRR